MKIYETPTWLLWRCDHGRQWTTVKGGVFSDMENNGRECNFSGCTPGHVAHIVGETVDRDTASAWFNRMGTQTEVTL